MPHFMFSVGKGAEVGGCVERVCLFTPWHKPTQVTNSQTGQPMVLQPVQIAWNWLAQQALVWPQGAEIKPIMLNPGGTGSAPVVYCIQKTDPVLERAQVNAPYGSPQGNGQVLTMPPIAAPKGQQSMNHGSYEEIHSSGLPNTGDTMMGEFDTLGGTFSDLESNGTETIRQMAIPPSAPMGR